MMRTRVASALATMWPQTRIAHGAAYGLAIACASLVLTSGNHARALTFGPHDATSVFFVSKSENRNEVHYAVRLDAGCRAAEQAPIVAYWRMHERGPNVIEPLLAREQRLYGLTLRAAERTEEGSTLRIALRAMPDRTVVVTTRRGAKGCEATPVTPVAGTPALLWNVHVRLSWPMGVDYLLVRGWSLRDRRLLEERVSP